MNHQEFSPNASVEDELRHYYEDEFKEEEEEKQSGESLPLPRQAAFAMLLTICVALLLALPGLG